MNYSPDPSDKMWVQTKKGPIEIDARAAQAVEYLLGRISQLEKENQELKIIAFQTQAVTKKSWLEKLIFTWLK